MKKLIFLALIWMTSTANVLAKEYDITPSWDRGRWRWEPEDARYLCDNGSYQHRFNFLLGLQPTYARMDSR